MSKVGQVVITVEPHVFEATMYIVKDPKPPPPPPTFRPVIQYGPPNGVMPPPPTPSIAAGTPPQTPVQPSAQTPMLATAELATQPQMLQSAAAQDTSSRPPSSAAAAPAPRPPVSHRESPSAPTPQSAQRHVTLGTPTSSQPPSQPHSQPPPPPLQSPVPSGAATPTPMNHGPPAAKPPGTPLAAPMARPGMNGAPAAATAGKPAPGTDPIILTLAEKAGEDPHLRDLMKRVAQGDAAKHELERFQSIIDEITAESKRKGTPQGPSADRLLVDGRTVRYFADEVRTILDIVLASNPKQTSADLRPPPGSDPLVVLLVKTALEEPRTRDMVRRIAENRPQFSDATDLKSVLDRLKHKVTKDLERYKTQSPAPSAPPSATSKAANGAPDGSVTAATPTPPAQAVPQQALRSKGPPPPPPKPDISAVVFEFSGGTGDRYMFPKFSILEYILVPSGQQVIASFMIVRKGSASEYPVADPTLDYYQPVTIRLYTPTGRHLENLARVVAPQDDVRRYMDDIMDKMTRAEYVLLAMRLPRGDPAAKEDGVAPTDAKDAKDTKETQTNGAASSKLSEVQAVNAAPQPSVMWTVKSLKSDVRELPPKSKLYGKVIDPDEQYQKFITGISRKEPEEV